MLMYTNTCIVPDSGYTTEDGYIRVLTKPRKVGGYLKMLHRLEWEKVNGPIPKGYEINHKCRNRECSNTNHMELLTSSEHRVKDNSVRYKNREDSVVAYKMMNFSVTQKGLGRLFGVSQSAVSKILNRRIIMSALNAREYKTESKFKDPEPLEVGGYPARGS